jgi:hypothetical protein
VLAGASVTLRTSRLRRAGAPRCLTRVAAPVPHSFRAAERSEEAANGPRAAGSPFLAVRQEASA